MEDVDDGAYCAEDGAVGTDEELGLEAVVVLDRTSCVLSVVEADSTAGKQASRDASNTKGASSAGAIVGSCEVAAKASQAGAVGERRDWIFGCSSA
jgi:hypothetical protein